MKVITCSFSEAVLERIEKQPDGLKKKIEAYRDILIIKGHSITKPYADKIEGHKNLFELRPSFGNIEYRLLYFWKGNHAYIINSFTEKGKKKENRREYEKAEIIKNIMLERSRGK